MEMPRLVVARLWFRSTSIHIVARTTATPPPSMVGGLVCDLPHASIIFWRLAVAIAAAAAPLRVLLVHCMLFFGRRQWTQPTEALSCVLHPMESLAAVRYEITAACMSCRALRAIPTTQSFTHTHIAEGSSGSTAHNQLRNRSLSTWF